MALLARFLKICPREKGMLKQTLLLETVQRVFNTPIQTMKIEKLAGDASDRVYYRLSWQEKTATRSYVLMALGNTKDAKTSEEITGKTEPTNRELPFIDIQQHLFACKIAVPEVFLYDKTEGWILLEDLGDVTFADKVKADFHTPSIISNYYQHAIDILVSLQCDATPILMGQSIAQTRGYEQALFEWEFDHFIEYGIEKRNGATLPASKKVTIRRYFSDLSAHFAALPKYFTHRDYHSRNLMMQFAPEGMKLRVIDFQDALMGPAEYDLASLLRDSYIDLPADMIADLVDYYLQKRKERTEKPVDANLFKESFDLISIQRNLKAAGRFVYIDQVKGKDHLLPFVTPTLVKVKNTLKKYDRLNPLYDLLAEDVPELR